MMLILLLPFLIELFGDNYLIMHGKKDISSIIRVLMIIVVSSITHDNHPFLEDCVKGIIVATIPYAIFDPALNLLRGRKLLYTGKTKMYDLFLAKFPAWVVLVGRLVFVVVLLVIYNIL